jgi:hypothetical protein
MENFIEILLQPMREFWTGFVSFVPQFTAMFIIIAGGILISYLAKALLVKGLKTANFDSLCDKLGLTAVIRKGDIWEKPTELFGHIIYWFLIIYRFQSKNIYTKKKLLIMINKQSSGLSFR